MCDTLCMLGEAAVRGLIDFVILKVNAKKHEALSPTGKCTQVGMLENVHST